MAIDHPAAQRYSRLELLARQAVEGFITGLHKSPYHGFSVEFAEHRAYNTGESTRHIDWKLYGRTDKLFVKRYEEETNLRCQMVIDESASMYYPQDLKPGQLNKVQFAIQAAAAIAYLLRSQRDAVGLSFFGEKVSLHTETKSTPTHINYLFRLMEEKYDALKGTQKTDAINALHEIAEKVHKRSLVVVFSDLLDSVSLEQNDQAKLMQALQHLRYNKHEVILFYLYDRKTELELDLENRPYRVVDLETGEKIKLQPNQVQEYYRAARKKITEEVKIRCAQYQIDLVETDVSEGVVKVLDRFFAKRARLH